MNSSIAFQRLHIGARGLLAVARGLVCQGRSRCISGLTSSQTEGTVSFLLFCSEKGRKEGEIDSL